jgi:hypothetical protein
MKTIKIFISKIFGQIKKIKLIISYKLAYIFLIFYSKKLPESFYKEKKILIVTAHPDDEIFSIAHVLHEIKNLIKSVSWINTTTGQNSINQKYFISKEETEKIRKSEFQLSMNRLGVDSYLHLDVPSYLKSELPREVLSIVHEEIKNCDLIFLIDKNDKHPDHYFSTKTFENLKNKNTIFYYNVQKITIDTKLQYFSFKFSNEIFNDLVKIYKSQDHMQNSFQAYSMIFNRKIFIYR